MANHTLLVRSSFWKVLTLLVVKTVGKAGSTTSRIGFNLDGLQAVHCETCS